MKSNLGELVEKYGKEFEIPENIEHYSEEDYTLARRGYILYKLGRLENNENKR